MNFIINMILIPKFQAIGASIGTIFAELTVMLVQTIVVRKEIEIKKYVRYVLKFLITAMIMTVIIIGIKYVFDNKYLIIIVQIIIGAMVYSLLNYKFISNNI